MPFKIVESKSRQDILELNTALARRADPGMDVEKSVREILHEVRERGDAALVDYNRRFDCPEFTADMLRVPDGEAEKSCDLVTGEDLDYIDEAAENIRRYHETQLQHSTWNSSPDGSVLGRLVRPVDAVGLYVPGGTGGSVPLISSLLMNAVPAMVAGVERIVMISPPTKEGSLNPCLTAAAHRLGIEEIYRVGSAWGAAALAYGTESIAPVDVIVGPGNIYVTTAKRLLIGTVGIDIIAGPSEIVVLADDTARPDWIAADLLSQAEHDTQASSILVTPSEALIAGVQKELEAQLSTLPRADVARTSLEDWGAAVLVDDLDAGMEACNILAPEHLEIITADPWALLGKVRHAGAVFLGPYSPEPVGDYFAGPNHVLPTMGTARFSSALSVENFVKKTSVVAASQSYVVENAHKIARLARLEGLEAHARSAEIRKSGKD
jgi:histidinol dehydrogenase